MSEFENFVEIFNIIGNPVRFGILLVLYGSEYLKREKGSLTFKELKRVMQIPNDAVLNYHLKKLIEAGLVRKIPVQETPTSRILPVYKITEKWTNFLKESGLEESLDEYIENILQQ